MAVDFKLAGSILQLDSSMDSAEGVGYEQLSHLVMVWAALPSCGPLPGECMLSSLPLVECTLPSSLRPGSALAGSRHGSCATGERSVGLGVEHNQAESSAMRMQHTIKLSPRRRARELMCSRFFACELCGTLELRQLAQHMITQAPQSSGQRAANVQEQASSDLQHRGHRDGGSKLAFSQKIASGAPICAQCAVRVSEQRATTNCPRHAWSAPTTSRLTAPALALRRYPISGRGHESGTSRPRSRPASARSVLPSSRQYRSETRV